MFDDPQSILESLRWNEDSMITNYDGEQVWLKACYLDNGARAGITDCCFVDTPCDRHKKIQENEITSTSN